MVETGNDNDGNDDDDNDGGDNSTGAGLGCGVAVGIEMLMPQLAKNCCVSKRSSISRPQCSSNRNSSGTQPDIKRLLWSGAA